MRKTIGVVAVLGLVACGGGGGGGSGGGSGASGGGSGGNKDAGASAGLGTCTPALADAGMVGAADAGCNQLVNCAEEVSFTYLDNSFSKPTPAGGTVADGLYALTAVRVYGLGPTGPDAKVRVTYLKSGNTLYGSLQANGSMAHSQGTVSYSGTDSTFAATCPSVGSMTRAYSADADHWYDLDVSSQRTVAYEYTRVK